jgi:hypothetical protein
MPPPANIEPLQQQQEPKIPLEKQSPPPYSQRNRHPGKKKVVKLQDFQTAPLLDSGSGLS